MMHHKKKHNKLGRTSSHRKAMLRNMASSLFIHGRIVTTITKAKVLRPYAEKLVTKAIHALDGSTSERRVAILRLIRADIKEESAFRHLTHVWARHCRKRPGGYTRIIQVGSRKGDSAKMAIIELVLEPMDNEQFMPLLLKDEMTDGFHDNYEQMCNFYLQDHIPDLNLFETWATYRNPSIFLNKHISDGGRTINFDLEIQGALDESNYSWPKRRGKWVNMPLTVSLKHPTHVVKGIRINSNWPKQIAPTRGKATSFRILLTPQMAPFKVNCVIETYSVSSDIPYFNMSVFSPLGEVYFNTLI